MKNLLIAAIAGFGLSTATWVTAGGDVSKGKELSATCVACHGADGNSPAPDFPKLAGQNAKYIAKQLANFKDEVRVNAIMYPFAAQLSEQDMLDLGAFYASQTIEMGAVNEDLVEAGRQLYRGGNAESGVPACMACHGPNGKGVPAAGWPMLSGQYSQYTEAQLRAFASGERNNSPNGMMHDIAKKMTEEEIKAVSAYVSGLN